MDFDADGFDNFGSSNAFLDDEDGMDFAASARITGRVARIDPVGSDLAEVVVWLVVEDEPIGDDDHLRGAHYQALKIRTQPARLWQITDGAEVTARCRFHRGQLRLVEFESIETCDDPMPQCKIPARRLAADDAANAELPTMDQLDKMSREGQWGRLNHSIYRFAVPVHIVFCPKYRRQVLIGREVEAQAMLRHVVREEGLETIACTVENADHVHLVVRHSGAGTPPTFCWAKFVGRVKALTSRLFKQWDPDFEWQVGYSLTAVHGGRQGAEQAIAAVRAYVENQGVQATDAETRVSGDGDGP